MTSSNKISLVEFVHSRSLILGNVKLDIFLMGSGRHAGEVYAIDFGCAKKFIDDTTNLHISYNENKPLTRNARYASVNAHLGIEQSRRDDMESISWLPLYVSAKWKVRILLPEHLRDADVIDIFEGRTAVGRNVYMSVSSRVYKNYASAIHDGNCWSPYLVAIEII